jgi:GNAT superfamily N-acetyltransferase
MKHEFFLDWSPDFRDHATLLQHLVSANLAIGGPSGYRNVAVILRDPDTGEASSGVWGSILYGWLFIELLYVAERDRGHGLGSRLLTTVENAARQQGCLGAWLNTYVFQAPGFYGKNGYEQFGELMSDVSSPGTANNRLRFFRKPFSR